MTGSQVSRRPTEAPDAGGACGSVGARLEAAARAAAAAFGVQFVHLDYHRSGGSGMLRLYVDREGGISLEDCARVSRHLSAVLDTEDIIPHRYTLEVSSPGLDRPLFDAGDYARFAGRRAQLTLKKPGPAGRRRLQGLLLGCVQDRVRLQLDSGAVEELPLAEVAGGRLELDIP